MSEVIAAINQADESAAAERVRHLRETYPGATSDALVGMLIKQKCLQTGAVGEVTSSASIIQGVGVFVSLIFGEAADAALTARMQAELVLEIAAAYDRELNPAEKQNALLLVTGMSDSVNRMVLKTGQEIAAQANQQLAQHQSHKTSVQVTSAAGTNLLNTYLLGRRAESYFKAGGDLPGEANAESWGEPEFIIPQVESQTLAAWLGETTYHSWQMMSEHAWGATGLVLVAGQALGEVLLIDRASGLVKHGWSQSAKTISEVRRTAERVTSGAGQGLVQGGDVIAGVVVDVGKKAGQGLATGAGKLGELAAGLLRSSKKTDKK